MTPPPLFLYVQAVVADENYYGTTPQMFPELLGVLRALGLADAQDVADLERMVAQVEQVSHWGLVLVRGVRVVRTLMVVRTLGLADLLTWSAWWSRLVRVI